MTAKRGPTLRAQWLGQQLRGLRERAGLSLRDIGGYIERDASSVSRMESGIHPARAPEVLAYLTLCGAPNEHLREQLVHMARDVWRSGWWDGYGEAIADTLMDRIWIESRSTRIRNFETMVIPGLLQTRAYAESVIRAWEPEATEDSLNRWVEIRMARQRVINQVDPVRLISIIDESVLRRTTGGVQVMHEQLGHLLSATKQPHIELRVLPFGAGAHASPDGPYDLFTMRPPYPVVGYFATPAGEVCVEADDAMDLERRYARLCALAMSEQDSVRHIESLLDTMD